MIVLRIITKLLAWLACLAAGHPRAVLAIMLAAVVGIVDITAFAVVALVHLSSSS